MNKEGIFLMDLVKKRLSPSSFLNETACADLFDPKGNLLLKKVLFINESIRKRIKNHEVYVLQNHNSLIHRTKNIKKIPKDGYVNLVGSLWSIYHEARMIEAEQIEKTVEFVEEILNKFSVQDIHMDFYSGRLNYSLFKKNDYELFKHVINVALLSALIGTRLGYEEKELRDLTLGAFLHDLGKLRIPRAILNKPAGLTEEEFAIMKRHPLIGEGLLINTPLLPGVVAIIKEHHERWNGLGYPYGLKGNDIHRNAQIVAVADVFEALTADRPYRKGLPPYHALEMIIAESGKDFNPKVVQALKESLTLYPENTRISLNTGEVGVVIAVPIQKPIRPLIHLLFDREGRCLHQDTYVNLMQDSTRFIERVEFEE